MAWKSLRIDRPIDPHGDALQLQDELEKLRHLMNEQTIKFSETLGRLNHKLLEERKDADQRKKEETPVVEFHEFPPKTKLRPEPAAVKRFACPEAPVKQTYIRIKERFNEKGEPPLDPEKAVERVAKEVIDKADRIRVGLDYNYVTPTQVKEILGFNDINYRHFSRAARAQLEHDFPLPDEKRLEAERKRKERTLELDDNEEESSEGGYNVVSSDELGEWESSEGD
jgi:hypothetical protein